MCVSPNDSSLMQGTSQLYIDMFMNSCSTVVERARKAWLMPLHFIKCMSDMLPLAIQIELYFCDCETNVTIHPLLMMHYLAFQCYHELGQYDHRDNALRQLVEFVNKNRKKAIWTEQSFNIAGHCLLIVGQQEQARDMFIRSKQTVLTSEILLKFPFFASLVGKRSSAHWYLENFC